MPDDTYGKEFAETLLRLRCAWAVGGKKRLQSISQFPKEKVISTMELLFVDRQMAKEANPEGLALIVVAARARALGAIVAITIGVWLLNLLITVVAGHYIFVKFSE